MISDSTMKKFKPVGFLIFFIFFLVLNMGIFSWAISSGNYWLLPINALSISVNVSGLLLVVFNMRRLIGFNPKVSLPKGEENIVGWRLLVIHGFTLTGLYRASDYQKPTAEPWMSPLARCHNSLTLGHQAPNWNCSCGFYGVWNKEDLGNVAPNDMVLVKVSAIGETIVCDSGFRTAQYRIDEIHVHQDISPQLAYQLAIKYQVPVLEDKEISCILESLSASLQQFPYQGQSVSLRPNMTPSLWSNPLNRQFVRLSPSEWGCIRCAVKFSSGDVSQHKCWII